MKDFARPALRILLSSYVTSGFVTAVGLLLISALVHPLLGPAAAAAATVGVIVVTPPDMPAPRRGKFTHFLPAVLIGAPLFFVTGVLRHHSALALGALLVGASFVAFLGAAWGKRGLPVSFSVIFAMVFALASPAGADTSQILQETLAFTLGACLYVLWGTAMNALLNPRYRVLALVDALHAVAALMRAQGLHFTMEPQAQQRTALVGRLMKQQAALADQLQSARNMLLEAPNTPRRQRLAGMLMQVLDMRDHLVACALDLDALRDAPGQHELLRVLGTEIHALAGDLEQLANAMMMGRMPAAFVHERPREAAEAARAPAPAGAQIDAPPPELLAGALARRVGYVHDEVVRLVALARGEREPDLEIVRTAWELFVSPTRWSWRPFLSLWRWDAPPLRHAIRAALAIGAGYAFGLVLPWGSHEYWILLTIAVVLRGSLAQTLERRNSRVAGTLLGCVIAGALLYGHVPAPVLLLVVAAAQGIAHAFALQRYLITAIAATVLALVQAHLLNAGASTVFEVAERVVDTLIGVGIAWIFSYVLPSWERTQVGALVARALAAQARHAQLALGLGQLRTLDRESELGWRLARREAYDSLSALVQAIQRSLSEPRAVRPPLVELERMVGHSYQLLAQLTAIKTMLLRRRDRLNFDQLQAPLERAAAAIGGALARGERSTPAAHAPDDVPPMLELPDESERDLSPWVLRRLRLAVDIAQQLRADATRATGAQPA